MTEPLPLPFVTDHAVLRYLQRVVGIDVEQYRRLIAVKCATAAAVGARAVVSEGLRYRLEGPRVLTVVRKHQDPQLPPPPREADDDAGVP